MVQGCPIVVTLGARPEGMNLKNGQQTENPSAMRLAVKRTTPLGGRPSNRWKVFSPGGPRTMPRVGDPYVEELEGGLKCRRRGLFVFWQCPQTGKVYGKSPQPCSKLDCLTCHPQVARRRGVRLMERFGGPPLFKATFTVPEEFRGYLGVEQCAELRRLLGGVVLDWALAEFGASVGLVVAFHPTGDVCGSCRGGPLHPRGGVCAPHDRIPAGMSGACPRCGAPPSWLPHFDLLMPLLGLRGAEPIRLPRSPSKASRDRLKARYADLLLTLAVVMRVSLRPKTAAMLCSQQDVRRAVVHYQTRVHPENKAHAFRYSARPFTAYCAGGELGSLRTPAAYGLAAPGATKRSPGHVPRIRDDPDRAAEQAPCSCPVCSWRAAVSAAVEKEPLLCTCCKVPQPLRIFAIARRGSELMRHLSWIPDYHPPPRRARGSPTPHSPGWAGAPLRR